MNSLRTRLILSHLLPIFIIVPFAGAALLYILNTQLRLNDIADELTQQAALIATVANTQPGVWRDATVAQAYVARLGPHFHGYVTLVDASGYVLAASRPEAPPDGPMPGANQALQGEDSVFIGYREDGEIADIWLPARNEAGEVVGAVQITNELADVNATFDRMRQLVVILVVVELLLGAGIGLALALNLERPLRRLAVAIQNVAYGQAVAAIPAGGPAEIQALGAAVSNLANRLQLLEEARRRLLANLVHELGRPLGALRAAVQALQRGGAGDETLRAELLTGMAAEIDHLEPLLDDLSQLHDQVLGNLTLNERDTPLSEWLPTLLPPWRQAARQKGLTWSSDIPDSLPTIRLDPDRIARVVGNLLSNSVKYTAAGGQIQVSAAQTNGMVQIKVSDTGPGISAADQARIFEPFYRGQQAARFPHGLGLGLTIAQDIVAMHGGQLAVHSRPGEGSQFVIALPL